MVKVSFMDADLGLVTPIGIGKFVIESKSDWNIPHLHYIVFKSQKDSRYYSLLLEFGIHFSSDSLDEQTIVQGMTSSTFAFLNSEFKTKESLDKLVELAGTKDYEDFWALYRQCEFSLAKEKKDISSSFIKKVKEEAIRDFISKHFYAKELTYTPIEKKVA